MPGSDSTAADRIRWLLTTVWQDNRSEMARAAGVSHAVIVRVAAGQQNPGRRLLQAIAAIPKVNPGWLLAGQGAPLLSDSSDGPADGWPVPVTSTLLPGPVDEHRDLLSNEKIPVAGRDYRASRYWYRVNAWDPVTAAEHRHIVAGDLLLMETDWSAWQTPKLLDRRLCAVLLPKETAPQLGLVDWTGDNDPETPAQLTVELFAKDALLRDLVQRLEILLFPGERVQVKQSWVKALPSQGNPKSVERVRNMQLAAFRKTIQLKNVIARCELIMRPQLDS